MVGWGEGWKKNFSQAQVSNFKAISRERGCCLKRGPVGRGLSSLLSLYQLFQRTNSSLFSTATYDPLIKSVISEAFGSRGKGKMVVDGERCLHVENGQKQTFFKGL